MVPFSIGIDRREIMADPYLCTTSQVKAAINLSGSAEDAKILELIKAATQTINRRYGREFIPQASAAARTFAARNRYIDLAPFDLRTVTSVVLNPEDSSPSTLTANVDYVLLPIGGSEKTATYTALRLSDYKDLDSSFYQRFGYAQITITGNWGVWADAVNVAEDVNRAAIETVLSWLDRSAASISGYNDSGGSDRAVMPVGSSWDVPFSAHRKLQLYNRNLGVF
jgi:hypothetical protein